MMAERIAVCGAFFSTNHRSDINTEVMKWKVALALPLPTTLIFLYHWVTHDFKILGVFWVSLKFFPQP